METSTGYLKHQKDILMESSDGSHLKQHPHTYNTSMENAELPTNPNNRTLTDKKTLIVFGLLLVLLLPFFLYTLIKSDIRRFYGGYDNCGNMCGVNNPEDPNIPCSGIDYTDYPYSSLTGRKSSCVQTCPQRAVTVGQKCILPGSSINTDDSFYHRIKVRSLYTFNYEEQQMSPRGTLTAVGQQWWKFLLSVVITAVLSLLVIYLLKVIPCVVISISLVVTALVLFLGTCGLWYKYFTSNEMPVLSRFLILFSAFALTIFTIAVISLYKIVGSVTTLFRETSQALFATPLVIPIPLVTILLEVIVIVAGCVSTIWMMTSRELYQYSEMDYSYEMNSVMIFTIILNIFMTLWGVITIIGFQYITVAGSLATWYFTHNKDYLGSPVQRSFLNALRFHSGTIIFGAFIVLLTPMIKGVVIISNLFLSFSKQWSISDSFLQFFSQISYIETAIRGKSFLNSGTRAAELLGSNAGTVFVLNLAGDVILGRIEHFVTFIATLISAMLFSNLYNIWIPVLACLVFNYLVVLAVFGLFSTAIDTLLLCVCEDKTINDGHTSPYYMSLNLKQLVEKRKNY